MFVKCITIFQLIFVHFKNNYKKLFIIKLDTNFRMKYIYTYNISPKSSPVERHIVQERVKPTFTICCTLTFSTDTNVCNNA